MSDEVTERTYYLIESGLFEKLLKTHFMLAHTLLLFEHLCSHSDRARLWVSTATNWSNTGVSALSKPVLSTDR